MKENIVSRKITFKRWITESEENRYIIGSSLVATILLFISFKLIYPFPNFLPDSFSYLEAAFTNKSVNVWPIGYSKFLRLFSCFTHSDTALVFFQYLLLQGSMLYFLFTASYLFEISKKQFRLIVSLSVLNPLLLYVSNFVSSDSLFATLSLIWFTQLIWIATKPSRPLLINHSVVLAFTFIVRYNALYYPLVSIALVSAIKSPLKHKLTSISVAILLLGAFIGNTIRQYQKSTGTGTFSAFGGWQLASNALFAYAHVKQTDEVPVPNKFSELHQIVTSHKRLLDSVLFRPDDKLGVYYLWDDKAPLKKYMQRTYEHTNVDGFTQWTKVSTLYSKYGSFLIREYPVSYLRFYLLPNLVNYCIPDPEFLSTYNMGKDSIAEVAQGWFGYKTNKVHFSGNPKKSNIMQDYSGYVSVVNLLFVLCLIAFLLLGGIHKVNKLFAKCLPWMLIVWLANLCFSVLASPIVLRYQVFPVIVTMPFAILLLNFIIVESGLVKGYTSTGPMFR